MSKKPFEEKTGIGKFLAKFAPSILGLVSDAVPGVGLLTRLIAGEPDLSNEQKIEAQKLVQQYQNKEMDLIYRDLADARNMQIEALKQDDKFSKRFVYYLASFWSVVSASFLFAVTFMSYPEANTRIVDTILGFLLGTIIAGIIQFFFGSSEGSKNKTKELVKGFLKS